MKKKSIFRFNKILIKELICYFFVALISTLADWIIYFIFCEIFKIHYLISAIISFLVWFITNHFLSIKFVFKNSKYNKTNEVIRVFIVSILGLLINMICLYILIDKLYFDLVFSKIVATGICFIWNFIIRKLFIFK